MGGYEEGEIEEGSCWQGALELASMQQLNQERY